MVSKGVEEAGEVRRAFVEEAVAAEVCRTLAVAAGEEEVLVARILQAPLVWEVGEAPEAHAFAQQVVWVDDTLNLLEDYTEVKCLLLIYVS